MILIYLSESYGLRLYVFFVLHPLLFSQFRLFKPRRKSRIARYNILKIICRPINKNAKWIMTSSSTHTNISVHDQQRFHAQYKRSLQFKFWSPYSFESYCNGQVLDRGHMYTLNSISRLISREWQTRSLVNGNIVKVVLPLGRNVTYLGKNYVICRHSFGDVVIYQRISVFQRNMVVRKKWCVIMMVLTRL